MVRKAVPKNVRIEPDIIERIPLVMMRVELPVEPDDLDLLYRIAPGKMPHGIVWSNYYRVGENTVVEVVVPADLEQKFEVYLLGLHWAATEFAAEFRSEE